MQGFPGSSNNSYSTRTCTYVVEKGCRFCVNDFGVGGQLLLGVVMNVTCFSRLGFMHLVQRTLSARRQALLALLGGDSGC